MKMDWKQMNCLVVATVMVGTLGISTPALAQEDKRAEAEVLNDEGKKFIGELNLEQAADRFRKAVALVEDPRYAFNLCYTLEKSGGLDEAKRACTWVTGSTDERLAKKAVALLKKVEAKLSKRTPTTPQPRPPIVNPEPRPPIVNPDPVSENPMQGNPRFPPPGVRTPPPIPPPMVVMPEVQPQANRFGVRFGVTNSHMEGIPGETNTISAAIGVMYGWSMDKPLQYIAEVQYAGRGTEITIPGEFFDDTATLSLDYVDFTGTTRYLLGSSRTRLYVEFGLTFSVLAESTSGFDEMESSPDVNSIDFSSNSAAGVMLGSLDLRVKYLHGLLDLGNNIYSRSTFFELGYWF